MTGHYDLLIPLKNTLGAKINRSINNTLRTHPASPCLVDEIASKGYPLYPEAWRQLSSATKIVFYVDLYGTTIKSKHKLNQLTL
jgi:hypothetical protein